MSDDTDMTPEEFRAAAAKGEPARVVASREEYEAAKPAFTEDDVTNDFTDAIEQEVVGCIGYASAGLDPYDRWEDDDDDGAWPFTVVRDGREFEVDIDVRVTELTPERKAAREAEALRVLETIRRHDAHREATPHGGVSTGAGPQS